MYRLIFVTLFVIGCSCNNKKEERINSEIIREYNNQIAEGYNKNLYWVKSPVTILLELVGSNTVVNTRKITIQRLNQGEVMTKVKITIEDQGLLDDSNPNAKSVFTMELKNDRWVIIN